MRVAYPVPMSERVLCRKCECMILPQTAAVYDGRCGPCFRHSRQTPVRDSILFTAHYFSLLLSFPFYACFVGIRGLVRRWRFPHDRKKMLRTIRKHYPDRNIARTYFNGVITGYFENMPISAPVFDGDVNQRRGNDDGGQLRRGEIQADDIPTYGDKAVLVRSSKNFSSRSK